MIWKRHVDQIRDRYVNVSLKSAEEEDVDMEYVDKRVDEILKSKRDNSCTENSTRNVVKEKPVVKESSVRVSEHTGLRRSTRVRKMPDRLNL